MSDLISTKPYMIRAIHEWCVDNNLTPHLLVAVNAQTRVPVAFVKDGEIVLNLNYSATKDLHMDNEAIVFSARFSGVSQNLYVPMNAVKGIFARENGQGLFFEIEAKVDVENVSSNAESDVTLKSAVVTEKKKPTLTIVK
jgi:stringent starvation protein B